MDVPYHVELSIAEMQQAGLGGGSTIWIVGDGPHANIFGASSERGAWRDFQFGCRRRLDMWLIKDCQHPMTYRWVRR